jgi:hypothetical protein
MPTGHLNNGINYILLGQNMHGTNQNQPPTIEPAQFN